MYFMSKLASIKMDTPGVMHEPLIISCAYSRGEKLVPCLLSNSMGYAAIAFRHY